MAKKKAKKKAAKKRAPKKGYAAKAAVTAVEQPQIQTAQNFILAKRQYRDEQAKIFQKRFPRK